MTTPPCRVCGKPDEVICYPDDHALTICPDCCVKAVHPDEETGHQFRYSRYDRDHECLHCGILRSCTDYVEVDRG